MRKCTYCGKEYPDTETHCSIDAEPLEGGEQETAPAPEVIVVHEAPPLLPASMPETAIPPPLSRWTDRQFRFFEIALVCAVAFGGSILNSGFRLYEQTMGGPYAAPPTDLSLRWLNSGLHQATALALLWYVLRRRSRTFSDLGFAWAGKDVGWSIPLYFIGHYTVTSVYTLIKLAGWTATSHATAASRAGYGLFGSGITIVPFLCQFLNPFYEELIVRAYLMTEVRQLTGSVSKAIILSTVLQTSYHFYQGAPLAFSYAGLFLIFSAVYAKTGRIAPIILAHLYMDVIATMMYYHYH
jgi:membrane protease YdiL (CAAX protease family)